MAKSIEHDSDEPTFSFDEIKGFIATSLEIAEAYAQIRGQELDTNEQIHIEGTFSSNLNSAQNWLSQLSDPVIKEAFQKRINALKPREED